MNSSEATPEDTTLQRTLAEITKIDAEVNRLNLEIDQLKDRRDALEKIAVDEMSIQRLDGVRVAGRSWRIEWTHSCSVPEASKGAVLEAAKASGRPGLVEAITQVNTARLKSILKEMAQEAGRGGREPHSAGTAFEGLVGEFVQPKLRHLTVG
jgi:hypothetical protein